MNEFRIITVEAVRKGIETDGGGHFGAVITGPKGGSDGSPIKSTLCGRSNLSFCFSFRVLTITKASIFRTSTYWNGQYSIFGIIFTRLFNPLIVYHFILRPIIVLKNVHLIEFSITSGVIIDSLEHTFRIRWVRPRFVVVWYNVSE
jgi:hypothetical protein